jgi:nicotinate phosphoribosyltransferase
MDPNTKNNVIKNQTMINPILTDFYQFTMMYAHWKNNRHNDKSTFDLYFRKNPLGNNYSILGGIDECFKILPEHIEYLKLEFKTKIIIESNSQKQKQNIGTTF